MLYGIEGILNGKLFGASGSSGGGESGGGGSDYWVPTDENGEIWIGEEVSSGSSGFEGEGVTPTTIFPSVLSTRVYRVTIDGVSYVCAASTLKGVTAGGLISFSWSNKNGNYTVDFADGGSHTFNVESWVPQLTQTA